MTNTRETACAKIWDFIYKHYEEYGTNIMDICARDTLSDYKGLTVIIPNREFMENFHNKIHNEDGSIREAKNMLRNTIIKRCLNAPDDFDSREYYNTLPIASGIILPVVKVEKEHVILDNNVKIKKRDDFKCPKGFRYTVWEVIDGQYPVDVVFHPKEKKKRSKSKSKKEVKGGGSKNTFILNIGKKLSSSSEAKRVGLVASIIGEYKSTLISDRVQRNPLLEKSVSLYNWLSMYAPKVYENCLPITDIHPGINLMLLILDPHSLVTDDLLFGCVDSSNVIEANGWNNTIVTRSPHNEWKEHLTKASLWTKDNSGYLHSVNRIRRHFNPKEDDLRCTVMEYYKNPMKYISKYSDNPAFECWYGDSEYKYRKLWQDQFRLVGTFAFSSMAHLKIVATDESDEVFRNMVKFRPYENVGYDKAATFSYSNNYQSRENEFLLSKFFMSTNFGYMPAPVDCPKSLLNLPVDAKGFASPLDSRIRLGCICNCHRIKYELFNKMSSKSEINPELYYGMQWELRQRKGKSGDETLDNMIDNYNMDNGGEISRVGGDPYEVEGGAGIKKQRKTKHHKKHKDSAEQRYVGDSEDNDDMDLDDMRNLTFFVGDMDNLISEEESDNDDDY